MLVATGLVGASLAAALGAAVGARAATSAGAGALLAVANLWVIGRVVGALIGRGGRSLFWTGVATLKLAVLFGLVYLLVIAGFADILPLVVGYGALPLGIIAAEFFAPAHRDRQG